MADVYNEINLKLVFLGSGGVGKTSLVNALTGKIVPDRYMPTIGSTINKKEYLLEDSNYLVSVNLWDIGGQRSFNPLNPVFFSNVDIAFLIYDITKPQETIAELNEIYLPNLLQNTGECLIFILGNKIDLEFEKKAIKDILKQERFDKYPNILVSAFHQENIEAAVEYATYNYFIEMSDELKENNVKINAEKLLDVYGKSKVELEKILINLEDISSMKIQKKAPVKVSKKKLENTEMELERYRLIQERLEDLETIKEQIRASFRNNLITIEDMIQELKTTPISSLIKNINKTLTQLDYLKGDFELKLNSLLDMDKLAKQKEPPLSLKSTTESEGN
jgi:small GTP-binding protein